jgi:glyoxylase-like metal-dependent hydrolase (beta-lactamase superfamily II)
MKIKWYGHAAFLITSDRGTKIITDPYDRDAYGDQLSYGKITDQADIVLVSHDHPDHNAYCNWLCDEVSTELVFKHDEEPNDLLYQPTDIEFKASDFGLKNELTAPLLYQKDRKNSLIFKINL